MKKTKKVFFIIFAIIIVSLPVTLHELAHFAAMQEKDIPVEKIGFGIKIPGIPNIVMKDVINNETDITINHLPIVAYVQMYPEGAQMMEEMNYFDRAPIAGAGIVMNIIFFLVITFFFTQKKYGVRILMNDKKINIKARYLILTLVLIIAVGWKLISQFIIPLLSLMMLTVFFVSFARKKNSIKQKSEEKDLIEVKTSKNKESDDSSFLGPIGIIKEAIDNISDIKTAFKFSAFLSIALAVFNSIPVPPLDGGVIIMPIITSVVPISPTAIQIVGMAFLLVLFIGVTVSDISRIFRTRK